LRNEMEAVGKLLNLPEHCLPMVGMCLGYPDQDPPTKPRLPKEALFFENAYQSLDTTKLDEYNATVAEYYRQRSNIDMDWSRNVIKSLDKPIRPKVLAYLQQQGFIKK